MGLAATGAMPKVLASQSSEVDVIVVGAGIAGLRAAQTFLSAGRTVQVLEAANRIGGRAFADNTTL